MARDEGSGGFRLGSCLFTLVEPHAGHEVAFHRWYERDHFYAGMLAAPHCFAGRRWVAPRTLRELPGALGRGSFLATYWIEQGHHDAFLEWAGAALRRLQGEGRMFEHRDHLHTAFCDLVAWDGLDPDGVPPELALDHPFAGLVAVAGGDAPEPGGTVALRLSWSPRPTPGFDVPNDPMHLLFLDTHPAEAWPDLRPAMEAATWAAAFVPTIPGTDAYLDEL